MDMEQIARFFDRDKLAKFLDIELVKPQSLERSQGKAKRVIDRRQLKVE